MTRETRLHDGSWAVNVERRGQLSAEEFRIQYVCKRVPVLIEGGFRGTIPVDRWTLGYFRNLAGERVFRVKHGDLGALESSDIRLSDYVDAVERFETAPGKAAVPASARPAYLHDIPLPSILGDAVGDLDGLPADYFPSWYGTGWWRFAQFFLGPSGSATPLHFDTLLTHNLFFQVAGRKRFIMLPLEQAGYCYRLSWRWFAADAENPDYTVHPLFRNARPAECVVGPGDILYLPPGTLHQVRSLDCAISFNVDWHTRDSALRGMAGIFHGMPRQNLCYNGLLALGLWTGIPADRILPFYKSYLSYMS